MGSSNRWHEYDGRNREQGHSRGERRGEKRSKESRDDRGDSRGRDERGHRRTGRSNGWEWNRSWSGGREGGQWDADERTSWSSSKHDGRGAGNSWHEKDGWQEGPSSNGRVHLVPASKVQHRDEGGGGRYRDAEVREDVDEAMVDEACADAKLRLVQMRRLVKSETVTALEETLKRKQAPRDLQLEATAREDVLTVFEKDTWDGQPSGRLWLKEWIRDGEDWVRQLQESKSMSDEVHPHWCKVCWKVLNSHEHLQRHKDEKNHKKRFRAWIWKYGLAPEAIKLDELVLHGFPAGTSQSSGSVPGALGKRAQGEEGEGADADLDLDAGGDRAKVRRAEVLITASTRPGKAGEFLARAEMLRSQPAAAAKSWLLKYRDKMTAKERSEVLKRIGLRRANDVANLAALQRVFGADVAAQLSEVGDDKWVYKEPTFSWLSGFYWHPESTRLEQQGPKHAPNNFCHLCEMDTGWTEEEAERHRVTRRHAENLLQWVESMGATELPSHCGRCPDAPEDESSHSREVSVDLEYYRDSSKPDAEVCDETVPPVGFTSVYDGHRGRVRRTRYLAVSIDGVDRRICHLRLVSEVLQMGPKDKASGRKKRWWIDLHWCDAVCEWKSLAIPVPSDCRADQVDFTVAARWESDKGPFEDLGYFVADVPEQGTVALQCCSLDGGSGRPRIERVRRVPIEKFVGTGQIKAAGGLPYGSQRPVQFATEDVLISFLLYVPASSGSHQLLMFFHGDMARGMQQCPQPGLADFCDVYGPALMVSDHKKHGHPSREFTVITPCCNEDIWWLRYPSTHDATGYAMSMELCLRELISWTHEIGASRRDWGTCFAGQSMGAYMALEIARAMPEGTHAVAAGAPCFDACRLEHLARRLVNVPVWLLIGRNDTMCSFEECASLALKMRDLDAKCIRLTSMGIKGHSEVGAKLEKRWLYEWLRDPMSKW